MYLKELVRYIHLNPVRAGIVPSLSKLNGYKYCGHSIMMGKRICDWQDTGYTLGYFGNRESEAKRSYYAYVQAGANQGRRPELAGGGLIRSLGGWEEVKKINRRKGERIKGDERILRDSEFVLQVLEETEEKFNRFYEMKRLGYDLKKVETRVCGIFKIESDDIYSASREKVRTEARGLFCYWAVRELGYGLTNLAKRLGMTQPGVGYAVKRGEDIARKNKYWLED